MERDQTEWDAGLETGLPEIDDEHRKLFALIWQLGEMQRFASPKQVDAVLQELAAYAATHFEHEEKRMKESRYPRLAEHFAEHQEFSSHVGADIGKQLLAPGKVKADELHHFLYDWLVTHIKGSDMDFAAFLKKTSRGQS